MGIRGSAILIRSFRTEIKCGVRGASNDKYSKGGRTLSNIYGLKNTFGECNNVLQSYESMNLKFLQSYESMSLKFLKSYESQKSHEFNIISCELFIVYRC